MPNGTVLEQTKDQKVDAGQAIEKTSTASDLESSLLNDTIPAKFIESCKKFPEKPALLYKKDHTFGYVPYKRLLNLVENFTLSLEKLGIKRGDRVAILSENRPEWTVSDLSVTSLGAIIVPIHTVLTVDQIKEIIYEIEPKVFIVSDLESLIKARTVKKLLDKKFHIVFLENFDKDNEIPSNDSFHFVSVLKLIPHDNYGSKYKLNLSKLEPSSVATIIYTPSSSGKYRGVQLTHKNILSNIESTIQALDFNNDDRFLSVLPLSHALEKTVGYYIPIFLGAKISYLNELSHFSKAVNNYKPTIIIGVPRLYEKIYMRSKAGANKNKIGKYLFKKAFDLNTKNKNSFNPKNLLLDKLVYKKVRTAMGGNIRFLISGGAALNPEIGNFFNSSGITMLEGYGLTETSPVVSVNRLNNYKLGTVGQPLPNVMVKIADDGEILIKGPNVTQGYLGRDANNGCYTNNGWFKTGDLGNLDEEGFLKITGKKKEIIVLSTGKNISPVSIESKLNHSNYIEQAIVVGDGQKNIAALIAPNIDELAKMFPIDMEDLFTNKNIRLFYQKEINKLLKDFSKYEQIKQFALIENMVSEKKSKIDRREITKTYITQISNLFGEK